MSEFDIPGAMAAVSLPPGGSSAATWNSASGGDVFASSYEAASTNAFLTGRSAALNQAVAERIKAVKDATGQELGNPLTDGYNDEAARQFQAAEPGRVAPRLDPGETIFSLTLPTADQVEWHGYQMQAFQRQLEAIGAQYNRPDLATPMAPTAGALADKALADAAKTYSASGGGLTNWLAAAAGGAAAGWRDPVQVGSLAFGGEATIFKSLAAQLIETFAKQGAINAGVQLLEEPLAQAERARAGQATGVMPAIADIGSAFLFGGTLGAGLHGLGRLIGEPKVEGGAALIDKAAKGDPAAARTLGERLPESVAPELAQALKSVEADNYAARFKPDALPDHWATPMLADAARAAEDPRAPLVEPPPRVDPAVTEAPARRALATHAPADAYAAADVLRGDPELVQSGFASPRPELVEAARLASLDPSAFDAARASGVDPAYAAHIAAIEADPGYHAALLDELRSLAPQTEAEARAILADAQRARATPEATSRLLGAEEPPPSPTLPVPRETPANAGGGAAAAAEAPAPAGPRVKRERMPETLNAFLKAKGGLKDYQGELRAMDLHRAYPGLVNNKRGLELDHARLIAAEAGFLGPDREAAMAGTTVDDLLRALRDHPRYTAEGQAWVLDYQQRLKAEAELGRVHDAVGDARNELDAFHQAHGLGPIDHELRDAAAELMAGDAKIAPDDALERAAIQLYERDREAAIRAGEPPLAGGDRATAIEGDLGRDQSGPQDRGGPGTPGAARGAQEALRRDRAPPESAAGEGEVAPPLSPDDLLNRVPVERDGKVEFVPRDELGATGERQGFMAQLIENCIL